MIIWTKVDNQISEITSMNRTDLFYNIIKEIPTKELLPNGKTMFVLSAARLPNNEYDHLAIYINGVKFIGTYENLIEAGEISRYDGFILDSDNTDDVVYCEYLPSQIEYLFNETVKSDFTVTERNVTIERISITLTHNIIDELINTIGSLESHLFINNDYNFKSFMIYNDRAQLSELSKMHISETITNLSELRYILDSTDELNTEITTYDPILEQEKIIAESSEDKIEKYNVMHENLIKSIRDQLYKIEYTAQIDLSSQG